MKVVLTGATGFIGREAVFSLARQGHQVIALVRNPARAIDLPCISVAWPKGKDAGAQLAETLSGADVVLNLAGESVAEGRWTEQRKKLIYDSRILNTRLIVEALERLPKESRPKVLVSASAIGFYGNRGDATLTEDNEAGSGFLAQVTLDWEQEALKAETLGVRVVLPRIGVVLGRGGGALAKFQPVILGSGRQWMSWIHLEDVVRFLEFVASREELRGAFNLTAPSPARNSEFTREFAQARGIPKGIPGLLKAPAFILRAVLGEMAEMLLGGQRVLPAKALAAGFTFSYPTLPLALRQVYPAPSFVEETFTDTQFVAKPRSEVFTFYSRAENLEEITPPWLNFRIEKTSTPTIREKTLIDYKLKIHGVPVRWRTLIEMWRPEEQFVDTQIKGPYAKWRHTHRFEEVPGGTLIHDDVQYRIPGGVLGKALLSHWIRSDVEKIFSYRKKKTSELFKLPVKPGGMS
jgi:uncharacterized protein (TIGR01777 family)